MHQNILGDMGISVQDTVVKHESQKKQNIIRSHETASEVPRSCSWNGECRAEADQPWYARYAQQHQRA